MNDIKVMELNRSLYNKVSNQLKDEAHNQLTVNFRLEQHISHESEMWLSYLDFDEDSYEDENISFVMLYTNYNMFVTIVKPNRIYRTSAGHIGKFFKGLGMADTTDILFYRDHETFYFFITDAEHDVYQFCKKLYSAVVRSEEPDIHSMASLMLL